MEMKAIKLTAQQIESFKKELSVTRAKVSKELKSLHPNREIVRLSTNHVSSLNHAIKYGVIHGRNY